MSTLPLTLMQICISTVVFGGDFGKVVGIAHATMTEVGVITIPFQVGILM
jgi:hypothetical protein